MSLVTKIIPSKAAIMPFSQKDRIAISLEIVSGPEKFNAIKHAKAQIASATAQAQTLDTAHANLFNRPNDLITAYHNEAQYLDGNKRTSICEQDLKDAAARKNKSHFSPADADSNPWPHSSPYASAHAVGKDSGGKYASVASEPALINALMDLITKKADATEIDAAITNLKNLLQNEVAAIVTNDPNTEDQANNNDAIDSINALVPNLTKKTKRQAALKARLAFISKRISQLSDLLGSVSQDASTGAVHSCKGLYGHRYTFMAMRIDSLNGSLTKLSGLQAVASAHDSIASSTKAQIESYKTLLPSSLLSANGNGTSLIHVVDPSFLKPGDQVYLYANGQEEIVRAVKSVSGNAVTLNDVVPAKYKAASGLRIYKDLT